MNFISLWKCKSIHPSEGHFVNITKTLSTGHHLTNLPNQWSHSLSSIKYTDWCPLPVENSGGQSLVHLHILTSTCSILCSNKPAIFPLQSHEDVTGHVIHDLIKLWMNKKTAFFPMKTKCFGKTKEKLVTKTHCWIIFHIIYYIFHNIILYITIIHTYISQYVSHSPVTYLCTIGTFWGFGYYK